MSTKSPLNSYELIATAVPGAIVIFAATFVAPELREYFGKDAPSIGGFGLFLIMAYIVGQLLQSGGNLLEAIVWWFFGGMPSAWLQTDRCSKLLSKTQCAALDAALQKMLPGCTAIKDIQPDEWKGITRQVFAAVNAAGRASRVDSFNQTYGLMRGIGAGFFLAAAAVSVIDIANWKLSALLAAAGLLATYRMYRFGKHYAQELFVQYLDYSTPSSNGSKAAASKS
ncbi:hypothetical protein [Ferrovibrio sp.]|uniref:hypothetical protein n=1 Tax=Ferrovibrio sp. TaxID=1917215 RepID=UPI0035162A3D